MQKNKMAWLIAAVALTVACTSCELAELADPVIVSDVEREFYIDPWEKLAPGQRSFQLRVHTLREQSCLNASIEHVVSRVNNKIQLSLRDVPQPEDCEPGKAPARLVVDLGALRPGYYDLTIDLKNEVFNQGLLSVLDDRYFISMNSQNGFSVLHQELRRVPGQTVWGYVAYQNEQDEAPARDFQRELEALSQPAAYAAGYYGYFQLLDDDKIAIADQAQTTRLRQFIYRYTGGRAELEELATRYRQQYKDKLEIRIWTAEGEEI